MKENFEVNLDNFTQEEKENFLKLVEKGNRCCSKRWRGKKNDTYYYIAGDSCLVDTVESETFYDGQYYQFGNYFKTKEEAIFAREKQYVYQQLKDYATEHNTKEIDWDNPNQSKWLIKYDSSDKEIRYCWTSTIFINQAYFTSEEIARAAVKEIGEDDIKKYLFGVNE